LPGTGTAQVPGSSYVLGANQGADGTTVPNPDGPLPAFHMNFKTGQYYDGVDSDLSASDVLASTSLIGADGFLLDTDSSSGGSYYTTIIGNIAAYILANPNMTIIGRITSDGIVPGSGTFTYVVLLVASNPNPSGLLDFRLLQARAQNSGDFLRVNTEERINGGTYRTISSYGPDTLSGHNVMQFSIDVNATRMESWVNSIQDTGFDNQTDRTGSVASGNVYLGGTTGSNPPGSYPLHLEFLIGYDSGALDDATLLAMSDPSFEPTFP
jgi:hypothetical protein